MSQRILITTLGLWLFIVGLGWFPSTSVADECLVSVILVDPSERYQSTHAAFMDHFTALSGDGCKVYVQRPNADIMSLRNSARKAVAIASDLIVTYGAAAALAAQAESFDTPILFADVYDPASQGLASEAGETSTRMTGIRGDGPVQTLLKFFREASGGRRLALVYRSDEPGGGQSHQSLEATARRRQFEIVGIPIETTDDITVKIGAIGEHLDGIFIADTGFTREQLIEVLSASEQHHLPTISQIPGLCDQGAFMSLETNPVEQGRVVAQLASRILAGENPSTIPLAIPKDVSFVVNMKVAKELEINIPFQVLSVTNRIVR